MISSAAKKFLLLLITGLLTACSTPNTLKELSEEYTTVRGKVVAPPTPEAHRLFLYIQMEPQEGETEGRVLTCVAENQEKEGILKLLAERVVEADKPLFLIGNPIQGPWHEYAEGVDFEVFAVGYYNPKAQKYQTVITTYGDRVSDMVRSVSWGDFLKMVGKKAVDTAL